MDGAAIARTTGETMFARDHAAQRLGIRVDEVGPGYARLSMTVAEDMVNGHDVGHGGLTFALADTAMAYASNSYNRVALAQNATINFLAPTRRGERLTAEAVEQSRSGRAAIYDVKVSNADGRTVALFRGQTIRLNDKVDETAPVNE